MRIMLSLTLVLLATACTTPTETATPGISGTSSALEEASGSIKEIALRSARNYLNSVPKKPREGLSIKDEEMAIDVGLKAAQKAAQKAATKQLSVAAENEIKDAIRAEVRSRR